MQNGLDMEHERVGFMSMERCFWLTSDKTEKTYENHRHSNRGALGARAP